MNCEQCGAETPTGKDRCPSCGAPIAQPSSGGATDWQAEVKRLVATGQKIEAIKVYREATDAGLAEAKSAVESGLSEVQVAPALASSPEAFEQELLKRISQEGLLPAIKWVRSQTQMGLKESKDFVDQIAAKHGIQSAGRGCLGMFLLAIASVGLCAAAALKG